MTDETIPKTESQSELAWNMLVELRKEIVAEQQVRSRAIGFKITFVSTAIGAIVTKVLGAESTLLVVPAFAALFFDFLITGYSISIKRKGVYCRKYLEPKLRSACQWPETELLWEEYMRTPKRMQGFSLFGNLGITTLAVVPAIVVLLNPFRATVSIPLLVPLVALYAFDLATHFRPGKIAEAD